MSQLLLIVNYALLIFWFLLIVRIIVEMVKSFSRGWSPSGFLAVIFEWVFMITDPPVKALRKVIPPMRLGGVALDLSVLVLFLIIIVLRMIVAIALASV